MSADSSPLTHEECAATITAPLHLQHIPFHLIGSFLPRSELAIQQFLGFKLHTKPPYVSSTAIELSTDPSDLDIGPIYYLMLTASSVHSRL